MPSAAFQSRAHAGETLHLGQRVSGNLGNALAAKVDSARIVGVIQLEARFRRLATHRHRLNREARGYTRHFAGAAKLFMPGVSLPAEGSPIQGYGWAKRYPFRAAGLSQENFLSV